MTDDTHVFELLPAYALDCLEEAEARLVAEHRLPEAEAAVLAPQLAYEFPKKAYKL